MATYDAHVADVLTTITKTLRIGGTALGTLTGATFVVKATNPSGVVESWTNGFTGGPAGSLTFVTPTDAYWDEVGTWTWDVQYTLGGVTATCDPITLSVGPSGAPPGTSGPPPSSVVNVRGYGAVADGVTDDGPAIQAALDAVAALTYGGIVYIPPGVYYIGNVLLVGSKTRVMGAGIGLTILRGKAGGYVGKTVNGHGITATLAFVGDVDHSSVEHLTVDHQTNGTIANGISVEVDGATLDGNQPEWIQIDHCEVLGYDVHEYLIWIFKANHCQVTNNVVRGYGAGGVDQSGIEVEGGDDVVISGNQLYAISGAAFLIALPVDLPNAPITNIRITDNHVYGCDQGVGIASINDPVYGSQPVVGVVVANNTFTGVRVNGVGIDSPIAGGTMKDVLVAHNKIDLGGVGIRGIYVTLSTANETNQSGIIIEGNIIRNAAVSGAGAVTVLNAAGVTLRGNEAYDSAFHCFYCAGCKDLKIDGNKIVRCVGYGIEVADTTDLECTRNTLEDVNTAGLPGAPYYYAVHVETTTRGRVEDNTYRATIAARDAICVNIVAGCVDVATARNRKLPRSADFSASFAPTEANSGTGANVGVASFAAAGGAAFLDVTTKFARPYGGAITVYQTAGTQRQWLVTPAAAGGSFRITLSVGSDGTERFWWEIQ